VDLHRLGLKLFAADPAAVQPERVVLIGHEADCAFDLGAFDLGAFDPGGGRPGLLYTRKRGLSGDLPARLREVFLAALRAAKVLEDEPGLAGALRFRSDEVRLVFPDRLRTPNTPQGLAAVREGVAAFLAQLHGTLPVRIEPASADPRECLALEIAAPGAVDLSALLARLG
jgi:hypothetical protein